MEVKKKRADPYARQQEQGDWILCCPFSGLDQLRRKRIPGHVCLRVQPDMEKLTYPQGS